MANTSNESHLQVLNGLQIRLDGSTVQRELGEIPSGSRTVIKVLLLNPSDQTVLIREVITSCECFKLLLPLGELRPGEPIEAELVIDFRNNENYHGNLMLTAEATSDRGRHLFTIQLEVSVRSADAFHRVVP